MTGSRIEQAIQRIEAALGRIDAASLKLAQTSNSDAALKQAVGSIIEDLDHLIMEIEQ